jgi:hypothetical protein
LSTLFEALWPRLEKQIAELPHEPAPSPPARPPAEILEELVGAVRSLDERVSKIVSSSVRETEYKRRWAIQVITQAEYLWRRGKPSEALLALDSLYRDTAPWICDLILDFHKAFESKRDKDALRTYKLLREAMTDAARWRNGFETKRAVRLLQRLLGAIRNKPAGVPRPAITTGPIPPADKTLLLDTDEPESAPVASIE